MHVADGKQACVFVTIFIVLLEYADAKLLTGTRGKPVTVHERGSTPLNPDIKVALKSCTLIPDSGPCRANIEMFYFNPERGTCRTFQWGGCQGNGNRFSSEKECLDTCTKSVSDTGRPRYCSLTFDYGFCFGAVPRYYYDRLWKVCKETIYSGCGGNKNNFYTLEQCESVCRFGNGRIDKIIRAEKVPKNVLIINPDVATSKRGVNQTRPPLRQNQWDYLSTPARG